MRFIHLLFFLLYGMVSILNHYFLRSAGLDYGLSNQALYLYAHAKSPMVTMLLGEQQVYHYMGLHVSIWVPLLSQFYWIFGSYTLLIFQNIFLIFGAVGLGKTAALFKYNSIEQTLVQIHYYVFFGIYAALANDYHDNVIAASFLPWLIFGYLKPNKPIFWIAFFAMLFSKENISIWLIAIAFGLIILRIEKDRFQKFLPIWMIAISVIWFITCSYWIMPHFSHTGKFEQLNRFSHLGKSLPEIVKHVFSNPLKMLSMFFKSHVSPDAEEVIKQEFLLALLVSGAWLCILRPAFLVMALPLLMQKLWNKETAFWGVTYHYQVEFAALISLALIIALKAVSPKYRVWLIAIICSCALVQTVTLIQKRMAFFEPKKENLFDPNHYKPEINTHKVRAFLTQIDEKEKVCAQANFLPHLANREEAYHFPYFEKANLIIMSKNAGSYYPCSPEKGMHLLDSLKDSKGWEIIPNPNELIILRRK